MKELTTTVVIVGSGSAGISAGFELYQHNIPFVMLEKGDKVGGAGKFGAHGVFAINSKQQQARRVKYGYQEAFNGLTAYNHNFVNGELLSRFLKASAANIDRLHEMGLPVTVEQSEQRAHLNDPLVYHKFNQMREKMANWDQLPARFAEKGNRVLTETSLVDVDYADGLRAVIAESKDGERLRITAKKVIFADGGYSGNKAMMAENFVHAEDLLNLGERKSTGVGIQICRRLGATSNHRPVLFAHGCAPSYQINPMKRDNAIETLTNLPLLWVDKTGHRFVNEEIVYDFALWANAAHNVGNRYYLLVDQATLDRFKKETVPLEDTFERQFCDVGQSPRTDVGPLESIQTDFDQGVADGVVVKADTIADLAEKIKVPAAALKDSLAKYNAAVAAGNDDTFLKSKESLQFKVEDGPFYAVIEHCATLGTLNGVDVDQNCQPLKDDGQPLTDLYIVGNNVSGLYSDSYPSYEGIANGFAFVSGWIAAKEARLSLEK